MLLEHRSNENQMRRLPRKPWWQLRTWAVRASWVEVSGSDCECGEGGEHSKRWQFWWEMMHDGSQRFCDRSKVISNLDIFLSCSQSNNPNIDRVHLILLFR